MKCSLKNILIKTQRSTFSFQQSALVQLVSDGQIMYAITISIISKLEFWFIFILFC